MASRSSSSYLFLPSFPSSLSFSLPLSPSLHLDPDLQVRVHGTLSLYSYTVPAPIAFVPRCTFSLSLFSSKQNRTRGPKWKGNATDRTEATRDSQFTEQLDGYGVLGSRIHARPTPRNDERPQGKGEKKKKKKKLKKERKKRKEKESERNRGVDTDAVGGSWRRNDYRPRTYSLPAIISSTNASKSIAAYLRFGHARDISAARVSSNGRYRIQPISFTVGWN